MARDTCRDLAACFTWKKVVLGFPNLASRLAEARRRLVHVTSSRRSHGVQVENGRVDAIGCVGLCYSYINVFHVLGLRGIVVI
jgi:hypothetical protein